MRVFPLARPTVVRLHGGSSLSCIRRISCRMILVKFHLSSIHNQQPTGAPGNKDGEEIPDIKEWARQNVTHARHILKSPPAHYRTEAEEGLFDPETSDKKTFLSNYLKYRGWNLLPPDSRQVLDSSTKKAAIGLLSNPLTYPLTLAYFWTQYQLKKNVTIKRATENGIVRIGVVGARAEATLIEEFWIEFLLACEMFSNSLLQPKTLTLDFIGPDVPPALPTISYEDSFGEEFEVEKSYYNRYFDEFIWKLNGSKKRQWDLVALFNPGLGHPYLKTGWTKSVEHLFQSNVPLLLTSFSEEDSIRDLEVVKSLTDKYRPHVPTKDKSFAYQPNPFASQLYTEDPFGPTNMVRANHEAIFIP